MIHLEEILRKLDQLTPDSRPLWGEMSAQRMVEHLTDSVKMAHGKIIVPLEIPEEKISRMQEFLVSEKPMAKNVQVSFATSHTPLRHDEMELAIDELAEEWIAFEEFFADDSSLTTLHPFYGNLNLELWMHLHAKHFDHHFRQFGLT
jgi:hydroxymethylglutaryl-CoA reductase